MRDLTILHLSDLHFHAMGANPLKLFDALIKDIAKQLYYAKDLLIVVTGDIVHQCNYNESIQLDVLDFFTRLKKVTDDNKLSVKAICFVPGNHDKNRSYESSLLLSQSAGCGEQYYSAFWKYFKDDFRNYENLTKKIKEIFLFESDEETFGCESFFLEELPFVVVRMNTAWSTTGNEDRRNLKLGEFQIEKLEKQYSANLQKIKAQSEDVEPIVIVMGHHPLNWLSGIEEDRVQNFLIGQCGVDANLFVCGHTHTRDVVNWSNNRSAFTTLSTGIGWPDDVNSDHSSVHSYAIYVLRINLNAIDIYVRSTNDSGVFEPDYRMYTNEKNRKHHKIVLPLNSTKMLAYFELSTVEGRSPKVKFLSNSFLQRTEFFVEALGKLRQGAIQLIYKQKAEINSIRLKGEALEESKYYAFRSYLQQIVDLFVRYLCAQEDEGNLIRFHFRVLQNDMESTLPCYNPISSSIWPTKETVMTKTIKTLPYGELIKAAFEAKRPLIYSINSEECFTETAWMDFITIIPIFSENILKRTRDGNVQEYPIITFGASIQNLAQQELLFCLDYYRFDKILASFIHTYVQELDFSLQGYLEYEEKNKEPLQESVELGLDVLV